MYRFLRNWGTINYADKAFSALVFSFSTAALAAPAARPELSSEPLYSVSQLTVVRSSGSAQDVALSGAVRSLIESYSISGFSYTDNSIRKVSTIAMVEAKIVLISAYEQLAMLSSVSAENNLAAAVHDDNCLVVKKYKVATDRALNAAGSCQRLTGSKFAPKPKKGKPKALPNGAELTWA